VTSLEDDTVSSNEGLLETILEGTGTGKETTTSRGSSLESTEIHVLSASSGGNSDKGEAERELHRSFEQTELYKQEVEEFYGGTFKLVSESDKYVTVFFGVGDYYCFYYYLLSFFIAERTILSGGLVAVERKLSSFQLYTIFKAVSPERR